MSLSEFECITSPGVGNDLVWAFNKFEDVAWRMVSDGINYTPPTVRLVTPDLIVSGGSDSVNPRGGKSSPFFIEGINFGPMSDDNIPLVTYGPTGNYFYYLS